MSGSGPYGPGRRSEPNQVPGGRREVPFGPDVSWPNGFRQIDPEARRLLESGYSTPGYGRGQYDHVDPGYGNGSRGSGSRSPAADDYGDPGYSDPSYDGPRNAPGNRGWPGPRGGGAPASDASGYPVSDGSGYGAGPGYRVPDYREPSRPDPGYQQGYGSSSIYPVTGAQEALPDTGPQPVVDSWSGRDAGSARSGRSAYPEQFYGHPRLDDSRSRPDSPPAADPRLQGIRYDELRYDEPFAGGRSFDGPSSDRQSSDRQSFDGQGFDGQGFDEPLDDDSWVEELRRSAPSYPQPPAGDQRRGDSRSGDSRSGDSRGSGWGQQQPAGWGQQPGTSQSGSYPQAFGYGQGRDDRGGPGSPGSSGSSGPSGPRGPRMNAGLETRPRPSAPPQDYVATPAAQVGVLTPPAIRRLEETADTGPQPVAPPAVLSAPPAAASTSQVLSHPVRPGHGLDGPEITSSWPAQPQTEDAESFEEFWAEDDNDAEYTGLFPGEDTKVVRTKGSGRRIGRRRGRSNDHRLWLALLGVVVVAGGAIFGILKFEFPSHGGPTHAMQTPGRIDSYVRTVDMEKETKLNALRAEVIKMSAGEASNVKSAVYESGNSAAGGTEQIVMFIGGHLANADPASSIASFTQNFAGAKVVSAGALGGKAACVEDAPGTPNAVAMCVFFDNDSFGEMVSPTMNATALANVMRTMRSSLETVIKQ